MVKYISHYTPIVIIFSLLTFLYTFFCNVTHTLDTLYKASHLDLDLGRDSIYYDFLCNRQIESVCTQAIISHWPSLLVQITARRAASSQAQRRNLIRNYINIQKIPTEERMQCSTSTVSIKQPCHLNNKGFLLQHWTWKH